VIAPGDVVLVNQAGRVFYAKVSGLEYAELLAVAPLDRRVKARSAKADVVEHWAHTPAEPDRGASRAQLRLEVAA
jgi:hypothetical protein